LRLWLTTILVLCIFLLVSMFSIVVAEDFDFEVSKLVDRVSGLYLRGVNISSVVEKLDNAVKVYEGGDVEKAWSLLNEVHGMVTELENVADETYFWLMFNRIVTVALLVSIPIAVYFLLPRLYLYLWFRVRRRWVVRW